MSDGKEPGGQTSWQRADTGLDDALSWGSLTGDDVVDEPMNEAVD